MENKQTVQTNVQTTLIFTKILLSKMAERITAASEDAAGTIP